jgi:hypothetical protein
MEVDLGKILFVSSTVPTTHVHAKIHSDHFYPAHSEINRCARQPTHVTQVKVKVCQIKWIPQPKEL